MRVSPDWFETYYCGLPAELWRAAMTPEQTRYEARGVESLLDLTPGARILDAPCGGGRLSLELARRGYSIVGIDVAAESIAHARSAAMDLADELTAGVAFVQGNMFELSLVNEFDAAICMGNSFGYGDDESTERFLGRLAESLVGQGRLLIDMPMMLAQFEPKQEVTKDWHEIQSPRGPYWMLSEGHYDAAKKRWFEDSVYVHGDRSERSTMSQRVWGEEELVDIIMAAGFSSVRLCSDFRGRSWQRPSPTCYVVADK